MTKCILLSCQSGISKKTNRPYHIVHYGVPMKPEYGKGYTTETLYEEEPVYFNRLSKLNPLDTFEAELTYHKGDNIITSLK